MRLPRFTAETPPPRQSGLARASDISSLTRTGDIAVARAIGGVGEALGGVADEALRGTLMEVETELSEFKALAEDTMNRRALSYESNLDANTYDKEYEKDLGKLRSTKFKNHRTAREARLWLNTQEPRWKKAVEGSKYLRRKKNYITNNALLQQKAIRSDDFNVDVNFAVYQANLWEGVRLGVFNKAEAKMEMQEAVDNRKKFEESESIRIKRETATALKEAQERTSRQMITDFWNGDLTDPQLVTDALRNNLISDIDAKYLRNAIMNPDPPKTDLKALAETNRAITDFGRGAISREDALSVVYKNVSNLDPTTGKSKVNEIFTEQNRNNASRLNIGRKLMEELIRDKDPLSGMFTDDEKQIIATAEAELLLDAAIEDAARLKRPLNRKDLLIEAINIGRRKKREIETLGDEGIKAFEFERGMAPRVVFPEATEETLKAAGKAIEQVKEGKAKTIEELPAPKTKTEFANTLRRLQVEDYEKAKAYYDKYLDKFY